jgi:hypothetical protein
MKLAAHQPRIDSLAHCNIVQGLCGSYKLNFFSSVQLLAHLSKRLVPCSVIGAFFKYTFIVFSYWRVFQRHFYSVQLLAHFSNTLSRCSFLLLALQSLVGLSLVTVFSYWSVCHIHFYSVQLLAHFSNALLRCSIICASFKHTFAVFSYWRVFQIHFYSFQLLAHFSNTLLQCPAIGAFFTVTFIVFSYWRIFQIRFYRVQLLAHFSNTPLMGTLHQHSPGRLRFPFLFNVPFLVSYAIRRYETYLMDVWVTKLLTNGSVLHYYIFSLYLTVFLSPRHGAFSGCGWRNVFQLWRAAANTLNTQSRTADKGWSSSLGVGRGANNCSP